MECGQIREKNLMKTVRHILKAKGEEVWSTTPDTPVFSALELMAEKNVGALPVIEQGALVGIFSERDYARKVILKGKSSRSTLVQAIMSAPVITVAPQQSVYECMAIMSKQHVRHLPVVDSGTLVGIISIGDVVKMIFSEQENIINRLEQAVLDQNTDPFTP
jgi:CBS domain-containing protein